MFRRRRSADDFAEEIKSHFELEADELQSEGLSEEEARRRARVEFGNAQTAQERFYLRSRIVWFDNLLHDIKFAIRQLIRNPSFASVAIVTLALGIAANSTIFSWINSTLLDPIPGIAHTSDMITIMRGERSEHPTPPFSYLDFADLRDSTRSFAGLLAYHDDYMAITGSGEPERIYGALVSSNYFEVLGVRPILGRSLGPTAPDERLGTAEAVLGYGLWQNHFGADPSIIGKIVHINLRPYTIVGVAPEGFQGCKSGLRSDLWIPLGMDSQVDRRIKYRDALWLNVLGKLKPGVDHRQAENELNILMQRLAERFPDAHTGPNTISSDPLWRSPFGANVYLYGTLPILFALALVLLLLACANLANLLLVRSVARRREFAIRLSIGATRWRLVLQLMVENALIALAGGGLALLLTKWTAHGLSAFLPPATLPLTLNGRVDRTVLVAAIMISLLTAAVSGVLPALRASRLALAPVSALKDEALNTSGGIHKSRLAGGLVVGQIALSMLLLVCAGLLVRSQQKAQDSHPGFDPSHVFLASFDLKPSGVRPQPRVSCEL